jgi:uncharacterized protein with von Willebrand factor type A (vWA) domain
MLYTRAGEYYIAPTLFEAQNILSLYQVKGFGYETLIDVANLASGGSTIGFGMDIRPFGRKALEDSGREVLVKNYINSLSTIEEAVNWGYIPGRTPILKAAFLLKTICEMSESASFGGNSGAMAKSMSNTVNGLKMSCEMSTEMRELMFGEAGESKDGKDDDKSNSEDPGSGTEGAGAALQKIAELKEIDANKIMLRIARNLEHCVPLKSLKDVKFRADPEGDAFRSRGIYDMDEMLKLVQNEHSYSRTMGMYRLVSQESTIREKGFYSIKKQLLYILLDVSGSMADEDRARVQRAGGIVLNRLGAVMRGEAELYLCPYDDNIHQEVQIKTKEEAFNALKFVREHHYSGGGTDTPRAINHAIKRIEAIGNANANLSKPDILVISDGLCGSRGVPSSSELLRNKIKIHAFMVADSDYTKEWSRIARGTGGIALAIK